MPQFTVHAQDRNGVPVCAKLKLTAQDGTALCRYFDGSVTLEAAGTVSVEVTRGKLYRTVTGRIDTADAAGFTAVLERIADPAQYGQRSFDAHNHVSRRYFDERTIDLAQAAVIAKGKDLNALFAGVPYDLENHREARTGVYGTASYRERYGDLIADVSDDNFLLDPANEFCKYRYGHVCMLGYEQTPPVDRFRDPLYHPYELCRHISSVEEPPFTNLPISNALLTAKSRYTTAFFAHPTSWWRDKNSGAFITNIAATIGFDILCATVDGLAIMGYRADQRPYRDLWFELLNNGYFAVGVAETDAIMDGGNFEMPPYRTYVYTDALTVEAISAAVKKGKCVVSSGPLLHMTVEGKLPGSVLKRGDFDYSCAIACNACRDGALARLELVINGEVYTTRPLQGTQANVDIELPPFDADGYVLALLYDEAGNMAITNPVYIRNAPFVNRDYLARVRVNVGKNGLPATGVFRIGEGEEVHFDGVVVCAMPPHEPLHITVDGDARVVELFNMDALQRIFKNLYSGEFNRDTLYAEGEVPAAAFCIAEIREILDAVELSVSFGESALNLAPEYFDTGVALPLVTENAFAGMEYDETELPSLDRFKKTLPIPLWQKHDSILRCYDRAWEIAHSKLRKPEPASGFVSNFLYTEFSNSIFMWGLSFVTQFGRYGRRGFDFIACLNNFYAKQHKDGFICRQINIFKGTDEFERFDPSSTGPNILAWSEWEDYVLSGDIERLRRVFPALVAYHRWLRKYRTWQDGSYFSSGWGCGMDNQPRQAEGYHAEFDNGHMSWIDITAQQILSARTLCKIAAAIGRLQEVPDMEQEAEQLTAYVNGHMWDDGEQFYFDRHRDGSLAKEKTIGAYWLLLADGVPPDRIHSFTRHLARGGVFDAVHRIPSLPTNSRYFQRDGGEYWRGGVWCITNYMVIKGLQQCGFHDLAHEVARNHVEMLAEVFDATGSIWESYDALKPLPGKCHGAFVRKEFVGFSGLGPITVLIEAVLGITPSQDGLAWRVKLLEEHGIDNYTLGGCTVSLHCDQRQSEEVEPQIRALSSEPLMIEVIWSGGRKTIQTERSGGNEH